LHVNVLQIIALPEEGSGVKSPLDRLEEPPARYAVTAS
jgi:hypothetical protein